MRVKLNACVNACFEKERRKRKHNNEILLQAGIYTRAHLSTKNIQKKKNKKRIVYTRITQIIRLTIYIYI